MTVNTEQRKPRSKLSVVFRFFLYIVACFTMVFVIETFIARSYYIPSASMASTLAVDDHILAEQLTPNFGQLQHGDIIVFEDPDNWLPASYKTPMPPSFMDYLFNPIYDLIGVQHQNEESNLVKRVIGLPRDHVSCCSDTGHVQVNGIDITEPYVMVPEGVKNVSQIDFDVTVPEGYVWVMGDNRYNSSDSRYHQDDKNGGFVPINNIKAKAIAVTWTPKNMTWLGNYPQVFASVENK